MRLGLHRIVFGLVVAGAVALHGNTAAEALCISLGANELLSGAEVVLRGRVIAVQRLKESGVCDEDELVTLRVRRLWKGNTGATINVLSEGCYEDSPFLEEGEEYVLALTNHPLQRGERRGVPATTLVVEVCSATPTDREEGRRLLKQLGTGRAPR